MHAQRFHSALELVNLLQKGLDPLFCTLALINVILRFETFDEVNAVVLLTSPIVGLVDKLWVTKDPLNTNLFQVVFNLEESFDSLQIFATYVRLAFRDALQIRFSHLFTQFPIVFAHSKQ